MVHCCLQTRLNLPVWLGIGEAFEEAITNGESGISYLVRYLVSPPFTKGAITNGIHRPFPLP